MLFLFHFWHASILVDFTKVVTLLPLRMRWSFFAYGSSFLPRLRFFHYTFVEGSNDAKTVFTRPVLGPVRQFTASYHSKVAIFEGQLDTKVPTTKVAL